MKSSSQTDDLHALESAVVDRPVSIKPKASDHLNVLDGWRGLSILLVLATHMLPLGPKSWELNTSAGNLGMSLFFTLSGFLITRSLEKNGDAITFFIRRIFRIIPLAFLYLLLVLPFLSMSPIAWVSHFALFTNYLPANFHPLTLHFWSLCVELHFYILIGTLVSIFGQRALLSLPFLLLATTTAIIVLDEHNTMKTHLRIQEIIAGGVLALIYSQEKAERIRTWLAKTPFLLLLGILLVSSHAAVSEYSWLRAYAAMALIGHSLFRPSTAPIAFLKNPILIYVAEISFALYIIHPATMAGWLGSGSGWEKYLKRPLSFALSFGLAHLSTHYFENRFIAMGKNLASRLGKAKVVPTAQQVPSIENMESLEPMKSEHVG